MDSDAVDASSLSSISQPLDVLRLELQNEPAFVESGIPKDDHTLTFVPSPLRATSPLEFTFFFTFYLAIRPAPCRCGTQALPESPRIQCVPGQTDDSRMHSMATHRGRRWDRGAISVHRPFQCAQCALSLALFSLHLPKRISDLPRPPSSFFHTVSRTPGCLRVLANGFP